MYKKCMRIVLALALLAGVAVFAYTYGMALSEGVLIDKAGNYYVKGHKKQYEKCGLRFLQRLFVADPLLAQVDPEVGVKEFIAAKSWFEANQIIIAPIIFVPPLERRLISFSTTGFKDFFLCSISTIPS